VTAEAPSRKDLERGEAHVWFALLDEGASAVDLSECDAVLSPDERESAARFRFPEHQRQYRISHALVRSCLSRYAPGIERQAWTFVKNEWGRPDIAPGLSVPRLNFNLSHTHGLAACAVVLDGPVGVDVEMVERQSATTEIADRYFADAEVAELRSLPVQRQKSRFFDYWALKESYIKAHGKGLAIPLGKFAFELTKSVAPTVTPDASLGDDPKRWQFAVWSPTSRHRAAITLNRWPGGDRRVVGFLATPPSRVEYAAAMSP
jgi:4'-phosphopantetheinyl transferase